MTNDVQYIAPKARVYWTSAKLFRQSGLASAGFAHGGAKSGVDSTDRRMRRLP